MQFFVLFWITLCLVVDTSTKSVTNNEDENDIGDLTIHSHWNADYNSTAEECKCVNGFCEMNDNGKLVCKCPTEWGLYTATSCRKCDCGKGSNCTFSGTFWTTKNCICKAGYKEFNGTCRADCSQNPCKNGGTCKVAKEEVTCQCKDGFWGADCSIEECKCVNGFCEMNDNGKLVCKCPPEWGLLTATNCRRTCYEDSNCMNGAKCEGNGTAKFCRCLNGTEGEHCEEVSECKHLDCGPDARCTYDARREKAMCSCENDDLVFDDKERRWKRTCYEDSNCMNVAKCEGNGTAKFCRCLNGTEGEHCEEVSECKHLDCGPDARCTYDARREKAMCSCENKDLVFDDKERRCKNVCVPNPCQNGGTCNATRGEATCQCKDGFRGADCSIEECKCEKGFCEKNDKGKLVCKCPPESGVWRSTVCRKCDCGKDSNCTFTIYTKTCICKGGYEEVNGFCREIPLIDTSTSVEIMNRTRNWTTQPTSNLSSHSLNFTVGRESTLPLTTIVPTTGTDPCTESPCQNGGTCVTVGNKRKCLCKKPYLGILCETDPCDWNPCKNGGVCKIEYETVRCFCREPFTGEFCESRIRIDTYVITLVAGSVILTAILTFVTCMLCQRYHVMRARSENS